MKGKVNRDAWVNFFLWWLFPYLCHNASYLSFLKKTVLLLLIIPYEEAIKRLQSFLFPFSGHSSISVISFCATGWANWIQCTRRARTINLYNGTVLFYLLFSTPFLMHSLILHAFISPSLQTEQMFSPSCSQPCLSLFFFLFFSFEWLQLFSSPEMSMTNSNVLFPECITLPLLSWISFTLMTLVNHLSELIATAPQCIF